MRGGWIGNELLQERTERADPGARLIAELVTTVAEDVIDSPSEWGGRDVTGSITTLDAGGIRLTGSPDAAASHATDDAPTSSDLVLLDGPWSASTVDVLVVEWGDTDAESRELHKLTARLDPAYGGSKAVASWFAQLYRLAEITFSTPESGEVWRLVPITGKVEVTAGASVADVDFIFDTSSVPARIGPSPQIEGPPSAAVLQGPTTVAFVWARAGDGSEPANVAWVADSTVSSGQKTSGNDTIQHRQLEIPALPENSGRWVNGGLKPGMPRFQLEGKTYTAQTATFTSNPLDLGATPTEDVEFIAEGDEPSDSTLLFEVHDGSSWITFVDGDRAGEDRTSEGGSDLSTLSLQQTYDVRVTLTPSTSSEVTPIARRMGAREITSELLDRIVEWGSISWQIDPVTLVANLPECELTIVHSGERDYRDVATELLSEHYIAELLVRVWWGHPDLARRYWLHITDLEIDDVEWHPAGVRLVCVTPLARLRRSVPPADTVQLTREAITYDPTTVTLKSAWDDLLDGQLGLPARLRGPGVQDATTKVGRTIDDVAPGKVYLDQVAYLAGGAAIESQGRLRFAEAFDRAPPVAAFDRGELIPESVTPGYRARITDFYVPFGYDSRRSDGRGGFVGEAYARNDTVIARLSRGLVEVEERVDDDLARWIPTDPASDPEDSALAVAIATRAVQRLGAGIPMVAFRSAGSPKPFVELLDRVELATDALVARDPSDPTRYIRGRVSVTGVVVGVHDLEGRSFTVWIQDYADIVPADVTVARIGFGNPTIEAAAFVFQKDGDFNVLFWTHEALSLRYAWSTTSYPGRSTVQAQTAINHAAGEDTVETGVLNASVGESIYVSALAYDRKDGGGAESLLLFKLRGIIRELIEPSLKITAEVEGASTATMDVVLHDPDGLATLLEWREKAGDAAWTSWSTKANPPVDLTTYQETVSLVEDHPSFIEWRLSYTIGAESLQLTLTSAGFDAGKIPNISLSATVQANGDCVVDSVGDFDTASHKIAASTSGYPSEATVRGAAALNGRAVSTTILTGVAHGQIVYISAFGYSSAGGGGTESTALAKTRAALADKPLTPELEVTTETESGATGTFAVTVHDEDGVSDDLYYRTKSGAGSWGSWTLKSASPTDATAYSETVSLVEGHLSFIEFRLRYTIDGQQQPVHAKSSGFDRGTVPDIAVTLSVSDSGVVDALVQGDFDTSSSKAAASTSAFPSATTVRAATAVNGRVATHSSLVTLNEGQTAYVSAFGYSSTGGGGTESTQKMDVKITRPTTAAARIGGNKISESGTVGDATSQTWTVYWLPSSGVSDSAHDVKVYRRAYLFTEVPPSWTLIKTETSPVTNQSYADTAGYDRVSSSGDDMVIEYRVELLESSTVIDENGYPPIVGTFVAT